MAEIKSDVFRLLAVVPDARIIPAIDKRPRVKYKGLPNMTVAELGEWAKKDIKQWLWFCNDEYIFLDLDVNHNDGVDGVTNYENYAKEHDLLPLSEFIKTTYSEKTRNGGYHLAFKLPPAEKGLVSNVTAETPIGDNVDIRASANSGIFLGDKYTVVNYSELAVAPEWLVEMARTKNHVSKQKITASGNTNASGDKTTRNATAEMDIPTHLITGKKVDAVVVFLAGLGITFDDVPEVIKNGWSDTDYARINNIWLSASQQPPIENISPGKQELVRWFRGQISKGSRNDSLARVTGLLYNTKETGNDLYKLLVLLNQKQPEPLSGGEMKKTILSIAELLETPDNVIDSGNQ